MYTLFRGTKQRKYRIYCLQTAFHNAVKCILGSVRHALAMEKYWQVQSFVSRPKVVDCFLTRNQAGSGSLFSCYYCTVGSACEQTAKFTHFTRFQLTACSRDPSVTAGLLVPDVVLFGFQDGRAEGK